MTGREIYRHRMKTEQEFKVSLSSITDQWRVACGLNKDSKMDYLFGKFLNVPESLINADGSIRDSFYIEAKTQSSIGYWTIHPRMIVTEHIRPHKVHKLVRLCAGTSIE